MQIIHDTMAQAQLNLNSDDLPMYHLRRIGPPSTKQGVADVMDFYRVTYIIGRSVQQVDFVIDSCIPVQSICLSRCHARIVRKANNEHRLYDDSLNGVFINDIKISGSCILQEGDKVVFGHPAGTRLQPGSRERQPNSEHQFLFEACSCDKRLTPQISNCVVKLQNIAVKAVQDSNRRKSSTKDAAGILLKEENTLTAAIKDDSRSEMEIMDVDENVNTENLIALGVNENKPDFNEKQNTKKSQLLGGGGDTNNKTDVKEQINTEEQQSVGGDGDASSNNYSTMGNILTVSQLHVNDKSSKEDVQKNSNECAISAEGTYNTIIQDIYKIRKMVDGSHSSGSQTNFSRGHEMCPTLFRSPKKDTSIQTNSTEKQPLIVSLSFNKDVVEHLRQKDENKCQSPSVNDNRHCNHISVDCCKELIKQKNEAGNNTEYDESNVTICDETIDCVKDLLNYSVSEVPEIASEMNRTSCSRDVQNSKDINDSTNELKDTACSLVDSYARTSLAFSSIPIILNKVSECTKEDDTDRTICCEIKGQETEGIDNFNSLIGEKRNIFAEVYTEKELPIPRKRHCSEKIAFSCANAEKEELNVRESSNHDTEGVNISRLDTITEHVNSFFKIWSKKFCDMTEENVKGSAELETKKIVMTDISDKLPEVVTASCSNTFVKGPLDIDQEMNNTNKSEVDALLCESKKSIDIDTQMCRALNVSGNGCGISSSGFLDDIESKVQEQHIPETDATDANFKEKSKMVTKGGPYLFEEKIYSHQLDGRNVLKTNTILQQERDCKDKQLNEIMGKVDTIVSSTSEEVNAINEIKADPGVYDSIEIDTHNGAVVNESRSNCGISCSELLDKNEPDNIIKEHLPRKDTNDINLDKTTELRTNRQCLFEKNNSSHELENALRTDTNFPDKGDAQDKQSSEIIGKIDASVLFTEKTCLDSIKVNDCENVCSSKQSFSTGGLNSTMDIKDNICASEQEVVVETENYLLEACDNPLKRKYKYETEVDSPKKQKKEDEVFTPDSCSLSSNQFSSSQALGCSQTLEFGSMTMSQASYVSNQLTAMGNDMTKFEVHSKTKDILAKWREKKSKKDCKDVESCMVDTNDLLNRSSEVASSSVSNQHSDNTEAHRVLENVKNHVNSCSTLISDLISMLDRHQDLKDNPRVSAWRLEIEEIKKLVLPKTVIAVVGDTGSGKSSLMNALLDRRNVLPTSGMRACTAVVVEVSENTLGSQMEADIVFLQKEEWFDELQILLNDLTGFDGTLKNRSPDPQSDAYASYCKVKAVYGRVDNFEVLERQTTVTHWLGKTKVIKSSDPEGFRCKLATYIETQEPGSGGQYWPIVKCVQLRIPNCDVCSSGAILVDLPGIRDSNAAREKIAKQYLKNCNAVWVVSGIHRAIDDKTAKDLLGESFRRQLLMDGLYGSISFICTKTDDLISSEIIRCLKLDEQTHTHDEQVNEMELQKADHDSCVDHCNKQLKTLQRSLKSTKKEVSELKQDVAETESQLDSVVDVDSEKIEVQMILQEYKEELKNKEQQMSETKMKIEEVTNEKHAATQKIHELEQQLHVHRKAIRSICATARNEYSKSQIKRDFKAGLKEMKRRSGMLQDVDEEDAYEDDEDDDFSNTADNLQVFCCSALEYQKLKNPLTKDGAALVFSNIEDTQIPDLHNYVHKITSVRCQKATETLIRSLGRFLFDIQMYLSDKSCSKSHSLHTKAAIDEELSKLKVSLAAVLQQMSSDIDHVFDGCIRQKVHEGASDAALKANQTCSKWGSPISTDKNGNKRAGGVHFQTYLATCRRHGVFQSPTYGLVDFNEELAEPMYQSMTFAWDQAFSGILWKILDKVKNGILDRLKKFTVVLGVQLEAFGIVRNRSAAVRDQVILSASNKLSKMVNNLKEVITNKQRDISRIVTPHVQACLNDEYSLCSMESGTGMFVRMKNHMQQGVDKRRGIMFDEVTERLMHALMDLQKDVLQFFHTVCRILIQDLRVAFEPHWDAILTLRSAFHTSIATACVNVKKIYEAAGLENTEETPLVSVSLNAKITPGSTTAAATNTGSNQALTGVASSSPHGNIYRQTIIKTEGNISDSQTVYTTEKSSHGQSSSSTYGIQVIQDLLKGKLEISPAEVSDTVATSSPYQYQSNASMPYCSQTHVMSETQPTSELHTLLPIPSCSMGSSKGTVQVSNELRCATVTCNDRCKNMEATLVGFHQKPSVCSNRKDVTSSLTPHRLQQVIPDGTKLIKRGETNLALCDQQALNFDSGANNLSSCMNQISDKDGEYVTQAAGRSSDCADKKLVLQPKLACVKQECFSACDSLSDGTSQQLSGSQFIPTFVQNKHSLKPTHSLSKKSSTTGPSHIQDVVVKRESPNTDGRTLKRQ